MKLFSGEKDLQKAPGSQPEEPENTSQTRKKTVCDPAEDINSVSVFFFFFGKKLYLSIVVTL